MDLLLNDATKDPGLFYLYIPSYLASYFGLMVTIWPPLHQKSRSHLRHLRKMGECGEEKGGINHICPFLGEKNLSWKPHSRSLLMLYWAEQITWRPLTIKQVERKYLTLPASLTEDWEWRRGWGMGFRLVRFQCLPHFSLYKH